MFVGFTALDNGFAALDDPGDLPRLQAICDRLGPEQIDALARKWLARLPRPFTPADRAAGYRYELSVLQAEFSLTHVLDRTASGRIFFEQVIRDNLDIGRPDQVSLIFDRKVIRKGPRPTPGRFRTRIITEGVTPSLHVDYKNSKIKQYRKLGRALRTETTINDTRDFGIGKRLTNLPALREIGFQVNRRLLDVQQLSHDPITGASAFTNATSPVLTPTGERIPGLRFADPRVQALLAALCVHRAHPAGFTNRDLRTLTADLLGRPPDAITAGQVSCDLRRLRLHRTHPRQPPLPGHRHRPGRSTLPDPNSRPAPTHRTRRDHRPHLTLPAMRCHPRLPESPRQGVLFGDGLGQDPAGFGASVGGGVDQDGLLDTGQGVQECLHG